MNKESGVVIDTDVLNQLNNVGTACAMSPDPERRPRSYSDGAVCHAIADHHRNRVSRGHCFLDVGAAAQQERPLFVTL